MLPKTSLTPSVDLFGAFASLLCLLHCAALPILATQLPVLFALEDAESVHAFLVTFVVPLAVVAFLRGYRIHGRVLLPLVGAAVALVLLVTLLLEGRLLTHDMAERITWAASVTLVLCHYANHEACLSPASDPTNCCSSGENGEPARYLPPLVSTFLGLLLISAALVYLGRSHSHDHHGSGGHDGHAAGEHKLGEGHQHKAPHGGELVPLGEHAAHIEWVHSPEEGELVVYVLDEEAEAPIRVSARSMRIRLTSVGGGSASLELQATTNQLTGERPGDSSEFRVHDEALRGLASRELVLERLDVRGQRYEHLRVHLPEPQSAH